MADTWLDVIVDVFLTVADYIVPDCAVITSDHLAKILFSTVVCQT